MSNSEKQLLVIAQDTSGAPFVRIENYRNGKNELAHHTIQVNLDMERVKREDIEKIRNFDINSYQSQFPVSLRQQAISAILESKLNPNENRSKGQTDNFKTVAPGIQIHTDSLQMYVIGFAINKEVIEPGEPKKHVNSKDITLCKKEITKMLDLKMSKYRKFALGNADAIKTKGFTINID